jgi:hypothetical protein
MKLFRWIDQRIAWFVIAFTLIDIAHPPLPGGAWNAIYVAAIAIIAPSTALLVARLVRKAARRA